jgi:hypothetical protein
MTTTRYLKINAGGQRAADDATDHVAALDRVAQPDGTHLLWSARPSDKRLAWKAADKQARAVKLLGAKCRLPTVEELFALADRSRVRPAIDAALFPDTPSDWFWTSSPWAYSPDDYAWIVDFGYGGSDGCHRAYNAFVRAVRAVSPGQFLAFDNDANSVLGA